MIRDIIYYYIRFCRLQRFVIFHGLNTALITRFNELNWSLLIIFSSFLIVNVTGDNITERFYVNSVLEIVGSQVYTSTSKQIFGRSILLASGRNCLKTIRFNFLWDDFELLRYKTKSLQVPKPGVIFVSC